MGSLTADDCLTDVSREDLAIEVREPNTKTDCRRPLVVTIGELLWDLFPDGERLGGAPANFAVHAAGLGAESVLISRVGQDPRGQEAIQILRDRGMSVNCVQTDPDRQTGIVPVTLADGQPTYEIVEGVAWDAIEWVELHLEVLEKAEAFCFGTLAQRASGSRRTTKNLLDALGDACLRVLDINFRQHYHSLEVVEKSLRYTDLLKLNDEEVGVLRDYVGGDTDDGQFLLEILDRYAIERAVLTLGANGCRVIDRSVDISAPAEPQQVVNTVGAGDAFTAAFVLHQLAGHDARTCAEMANRAGGFVTTQDSGTPVFPGGYGVF